jgi:ribosomal protein S25
MNRRGYLTIGILVLSAVLAVACKTTAEKESARAEKQKAKLEKQEAKRKSQMEKLRTLNDDEIYVVGRIELVPKIRKEEQNLKTIGSGRLADKAHVFFSDRFVDVTEQSFGIIKHASEVTMEEDFVIKRKKGDLLYFSGGSIWLESSATHSGYMGRNTTIHTNRLFLTGDMVYKFQPGDKAVYVGTLRYHRDAYNGITKVSHINEYARANAKFQGVVKNPVIKLRQGLPKKQKGVW